MIEIKIHVPCLCFFRFFLGGTLTLQAANQACNLQIPVM